MTKPKHTPGPWVVETYHGSLLKICKPDFKIGDEVTHRLEADARLIAAAPEMLEALENALGAFNERECSCDFEDGPDGPRGRACYFHRIEDEIKRAIRKATGGPNG